MRRPGFSTLSVHGERQDDQDLGGTAPAVYPASVYAFPDLATTEAVFDGTSPGYIYSRFAHPTGDRVERTLAALDDAEDSVLCSSGLSALSLILLAHCRSGDHVLAGRELYGGSAGLLRDLAPRLGIEVTWLGRDELAEAGDHVRPHTRLVFVESPTNPLVRLVDFETLFESLGSPRPLTVLDGTFATPLGHHGRLAGFDLIMHSATKYLGGHDDLVAGVVNGSAELLEPIRHQRRQLGMVCDPRTAWLLGRGLKTLAVRWERQCENAGVLAGRLEQHDGVERVHYPGLASHPQHGLARRQMRTFGAMLAFEVPGERGGAARIYDRVRLVRRAPSLGGVESLMLHPATASHRGLSPQERREQGITEGLLRLSVGIEDVDDLWEDLEQALA